VNVSSEYVRSLWRGKLQCEHSKWRDIMAKERGSGKKVGSGEKNNCCGEKVKDTGEKEEKHNVFPVKIILCCVWPVQPAQHSSARPSVPSLRTKFQMALLPIPGQIVEQVFQVCFSRSTSGCVLWAQQ
jgi:hypothetical protein